MKTKIILLISIGLLLLLNEVKSQTYYYNASKTFYENGYTYQCSTNLRDLSVTLYNKDNKYMFAKQPYKEGSFTDLDVFRGKVSLIEDDTWTKPKCRSIVSNAFSAAEKKRLKNAGLDVCMTIDTKTGKVIEVDFWFSYKGGFATIPVSIYRKIETELKNSIWFTLTKEGKSLDFVKRSWMYEVE